MVITDIFRRELRGMQLKSGLCFYLGIPLFVGLLLGWNQVFIGKDVSRVVSIGFWSGLSLLEWFAAILGSQAIYSVFRPWRPPAWVIWMFGVILSVLVFFYPISKYLEFGSVLGGSSHLPAHLRADSGMQFLFMVAADVFPGMALWMAANYFYTEFLGIPRHRYPDAVSTRPGVPADQPTSRPVQTASMASSADQPKLPRFMQNVSPEIHGKLLALEAQDHYVRITTDNGQELIHYRFSDAVRDARGLPGLRVHRSFWVSQDAIEKLERENHRYRLRLTNDMNIPVSRSYLRDVRALLN